MSSAASCVLSACDAARADCRGSEPCCASEYSDVQAAAAEPPASLELYSADWLRMGLFEQAVRAKAPHARHWVYASARRSAYSAWHACASTGVICERRYFVSHGLGDAHGGRFAVESAALRLTGEVASVVRALCSAVAVRVSTDLTTAAADAADEIGAGQVHAAAAPNGAGVPGDAHTAQAVSTANPKWGSKIAAVISAHMNNVAWEVHLPRSSTAEGRMALLERHYAADVCAVLLRNFALSPADAQRALSEFVRAETERCSEAPHVSGRSARSPSALRRVHPRRPERGSRPPPPERRGLK